MMEHTQGTWRVTGGGTIRYIDVSVGNGLVQEVATCMRTEYGDMEANARRIVACVNACAGIDTAHLELAGEYCVTVIDELNRVKAQRDALLVALEYCIKQVPEFSDVTGIASAIQQVRSKE